MKLFFFFWYFTQNVVDLEALLQMLHCRYYFILHYPLEVSSPKGIVLCKSIVE